MGTIKEFKTRYGNVCLKEDLDGNQILDCEIEGRYYGFNVDWVQGDSVKTKDERLLWLAEVYSGHLFDRGKDAREALRIKINENKRELDRLLDYE